MSDPFVGLIELVGGPLDGQECAVQLPVGDKDTLFFKMYPFPANVFTNQVCPGMTLFEYRWERFDKGTAYYFYVGKKVVG